MKKRITALILFNIWFLVWAVCAASALQQPEKVVEDMLNKLKETSDYSVVVDFMHWPSAFESIGAAERKRLGIESAEQLKEHSRKITTLTLIRLPLSRNSQ